MHYHILHKYLTSKERQFQQRKKLPRYILADNIHHKENYLRHKVFIYSNNKNKKFWENSFRN